MEKYLTPNLIAEFTCLVFALLFLLRDRSGWLMMIPYLAIVVAVEFTGKRLSSQGLSNQWIYNIFLLAEAGFVSYMFYTLLQKKAWIFSGLFLFLLSFALEVTFSGYLRFLSITNIVSSALFIFYGLYYYYELLNNDEFYDLNSYAPFWWVSGTLFFYFGSTVCNVFFEYLSQLTTNDLGFNVRYYITMVLIFILYSCWTYSFICRFRQRRLSSLSPLEA